MATSPSSFLIKYLSSSHNTLSFIRANFDKLCQRAVILLEIESTISNTEFVKSFHLDP